MALKNGELLSTGPLPFDQSKSMGPALDLAIALEDVVDGKTEQWKGYINIIFGLFVDVLDGGVLQNNTLMRRARPQLL